MGPGRQPRASAPPGAHRSGPTASPSASPGLRVHAGRRPLPAPRVCVYVPALASLRVVSSVQCSPEGWGPLVGVESSKAAAAQRVSDTPWREARSGLVKHDPLAEPLSFPCSPPARLPPSPLWPCGAGSLSFTSTACYKFKTTLTNQTISPEVQNFQLLFTGTKT